MILSIDVFGEEMVARELLRFAHRSLDVRPAWLAIVQDVRDSAEAQFDSEGRHGSGGWAPLAESTLAAKERLGQDPRILHATLALRNSLTGEDESNANVVMTPSTLSISSEVESAGFHMRGTQNMPQRPPIEFTAVERQNFVRTLQRYIVEGQLGLEAVA